MASLNDVKNDSGGFIPSISAGNTGFVPSINQEVPKETPAQREQSLYAGKKSINDLHVNPDGSYYVDKSEQEEAPAPKKPNVVSMTTGKAVKRNPVTPSKPSLQKKEKAKLVEADLSSLPEHAPNEDPTPATRDRVKEVLEPGGEWDQFVERKKKEAAEFNRRMALEAEMTGKTLVNPDGTPVSQEEINALTGGGSMTSTNESNLNEVDIMGDFDANTPSANETTGTDIPVRNREVSQPSPEEIAADNEIPILDEDTFGDDFDPVNEETSALESTVNDGNDFGDDETEDLNGMIETEQEEEPVDTKDDTLDDNSNPEVESEPDDSIGITAKDHLELESGYIEENQAIVDDPDETEKKVEESEDTTEHRREILKALVRKKIKPATKRLNIQAFTVAENVSANSIPTNQTKKVSVVKWPLINTGICVRMKEFSGQDIERLRYSLNNNDARNALQMVYEHITSAKPDTFDAWMKSVVFDDYDHLFFAIYCASFVGANYIPIDCQNASCQQKTYVTDDIPFMQMVKFENDEAKKEFMRIYKEDPIESKGLIPTTRVAISENYAISFISPTLYSTFMISELLDDDFVQRYNNTISNIPYIYNIYKIDVANQRLVPIKWKEYANNEGKTLKSKVITYEHVFNDMTIDELAAVDGCIQKLNEKTSAVTYQIPETTCPFCKHINKAQVQEPSTLLFLRSQLGRLVTL